MAEKHKAEKYAYLDQLSTEALEEILRADIESPENDNDEVVFHILEVIVQRERENPTGDIFDMNRALAEFKQHYNTSEGEGLSLYPTEDEEENLADDREEVPALKQQQKTKVIHLSRALKVASAAAIVIICTFGLMIGVQAAGIDIFGAIGRWTDETFHFVTSPSGTVQNDVPLSTTFEDSTPHSIIQAALDDCNISEKLAPTWYPSGFELIEHKVINDEFSNVIHCFFENGDNKFFSIQVRKYTSTSDIELLDIEKDAKNIELYTSTGKDFYMLSNMDTTMATWSDNDLLVESITGNISRDDIKKMIDSIGG